MYRKAVRGIALGEIVRRIRLKPERVNGYDIMHAITVYKLPNGSLVSGGHHRVAAMRLLGEKTIPARVYEWSSINPATQQRLLNNAMWGSTLRGYLQ